MVNKIWSAILVILLVVMGSGYALGLEPLGTTLYSASYNQKPISGVYHSEILRYSDLSTTDSNIKILFIAEATELETGGVINATVSIQRYNSSVTESYSYTKDYAYDLEADPLSFYVDLRKGDNALVTIFNVSSNMTTLQIVRDENAPRVTVSGSTTTWLDTFATGFAKVWEFESNFVESLSTPAYLGFMVLEIIIIPTLFVLLLAWSFRKVREAFLK